jgi:hypothetical protein
MDTSACGNLKKISISNKNKIVKSVGYEKECEKVWLK